MKIGVRQFQVHPKKRHTKASQYSATLDLIPSNAHQECVATALTIYLFSGLHSSLTLGPRSSCRHKSVLAIMRVSCLQAKGRQHHLSQNIGPAIAGSARPAPTALSERNECVKDS